MNTKRTQGFTLIELMIVVAIIGILAAIAIPAYNGYINSAKGKAHYANFAAAAALAGSAMAKFNGDAAAAAAGCVVGTAQEPLTTILNQGGKTAIGGTAAAFVAGAPIAGQVGLSANCPTSGANLVVTLGPAVPSAVYPGGYAAQLATFAAEF